MGKTVKRTALKPPDNETKRAYIITRLMFGVFQILDSRDTLRLSKLYSMVYKALLVFKTQVPELDKELIAEAKDIWTKSREISDFKIRGDALYIMLEYLSSMLSSVHHKKFLDVNNYMECNRDISSEDKLELIKIILFTQDRLYDKYKIELPTNTFVYKKVKVKKVRDKSKKKKKVQQKNTAGAIKYSKAKNEVKKNLKDLVNSARNKNKLKNIDDSDGQYS